MTALLLISYVVLWLVVLCLGFLLMGTLRASGVLSWRLEQLEATTPRRLGRDGLQLGHKAPDFTLPSTANGERSLHDFAGRKVLLVFTQSGCGPCQTIAPELDRLHDQGQHQVVVINNGEPEETRKWAAETGARFLVLAQEHFSLSKRYQVFATPFAFLIDEQGVIKSKGIVGSREHLGYVLTGAGRCANGHRNETQIGGIEPNQTVASAKVEAVETD